MGSNSSKPHNESVDLTQKNDLEHEVNPDPRSPTPEIIRTPLQVNRTIVINSRYQVVAKVFRYT